MKKLISLLLTAGLACSMLGTAAYAEEASGDVTIWYYWETEGHQKALNHIIEEFNGSQDSITVEAKYVPFADFKKQLSIGASADDLPDLVILDNPDHAAYAAMGIFADITDKFDVSNYYEGPVNSCTLDEKLYGVPFGSNDLVLFYNEDMLKEAGCEVPTTWDELLEVAKATTTDSVFGFAHCALQNEEGTFNFLPWVWSTGATSYEINSEGGIKALNFEKELVDSGAMTKEAINWTQGDTMHQFIAGNLAMMINGTWQIPTMREEVPDLNWNVAPIPQDKEQASGLGGENYAVIAGGNEDAAVKFLEFATTPETCLYMMNAMGYISADSTIAKDQFEGDEVYQVFVDEMQYAHARGPLPEWPSISDAISLAFNKVITGESAPKDAAAEAQATIDGIIG
ncbi:sugar ABC transporter substrate-binding protein [Porcincola intestinalis]|uniref:ABC transporter substrate-binding protein n=1 Tax=Porcincola intestinalis TaxID=2606632 RepID=A0A6L5X090_9FIRM|nr:ABC transporter substrate-binding protein [Porcincola intestinalis]MSS13751.1 ABC transporter substrate-binding protein [Porcincola intestinalis]